MSNLVNKVKDAIHTHHDKDHHHDSSTEDTPRSDSVTASDHISPTNPGVLQSTKPGIHGARDSGNATFLPATGDASLLAGTTWGAHAGKSVAGPEASVIHGDTISPTNPGVMDSTKPGIHGMRDSGTGITAGYEEAESRGSQIHEEQAAKAVAGFGGAIGSAESALVERRNESEFGTSGGIMDGNEQGMGTTTTVTAERGNFVEASGYDGGRGAGSSGAENFQEGSGLSGERRY